MWVNPYSEGPQLTNHSSGDFLCRWETLWSCVTPSSKSYKTFTAISICFHFPLFSFAALSLLFCLLWLLANSYASTRLQWGNPRQKKKKTKTKNRKTIKIEKTFLTPKLICIEFCWAKPKYNSPMPNPWMISLLKHTLLGLLFIPLFYVFLMPHIKLFMKCRWRSIFMPHMRFLFWWVALWSDHLLCFMARTLFLWDFLPPDSPLNAQV